MNKISLLVGSLATALVASCGQTQTFGEEVSGIGAQWKKGDAQVKKGRKLVADGEKMQRKGRNNVKKGEDLIESGRKLMKAAERDINGRQGS